MQRHEALRLKLSIIEKRLKKAGVRWVVFAGAAAHCYGSRREMTDIDILVKAVDLEKAKTALKDIENLDIVADLEISTSQGVCRFFMDDEMITRTRWMQLLGVTVPVIPVEDNIVFKAILQREENQGKHDIEDIKCMTKNEKINLEYLEKRIRKCQAERRAKPLLRLFIPTI